nr:hypothetical protein BaRGS_006368 [Batillaria attramentaria]
MYVTEAHYVVVAEAKNDYSSVTQTLSFDISEVSCTMPEVTGLVTLNDTRLDDAELRINRWTLDYKLYRVTFNMSMLNTGTNLRFLTSNYSYFMVVKSPLVGMMMEGGPSEVQVSADSKILTLTPLKYSYDPDVFNKDPSASNMSVKEWTCGYRNSSKETLGKSTTDDCPTSILANSSLGTSDHLTVRLEGMIDRTYEINVTMTKDDRNVTASLILDVVNRKLERVKIE